MTSNNIKKSSAGFTRTIFARQNLRGFTLMEIMIVIVLLGILAAVGIGAFVSTQKKGRDIRRKGDLANVAKALELFMNDKNRYPPDNTMGSILACMPDGNTACTWGLPFKDPSVIYMPTLPKDPIPSATYYYSGGNTFYQLYAYLENTQDPDLARDTNGDLCTYNATDCGGGKKCNWGISSTNFTLEDNDHACVQ